METQSRYSTLGILRLLISTATTNLVQVRGVLTVSTVAAKAFQKQAAKPAHRSREVYNSHLFLRHMEVES